MEIRVICASAKLKRQDAISFRNNTKDLFTGYFVEEKPYPTEPNTKLYFVVWIPPEDFPTIADESGRPTSHEMTVEKSRLMKEIK